MHTKTLLATAGLLGAVTLMAPGAGAGHTSITVSGTGVHHFTTATVHSQEFTQTGMIQRSTEIVDLSGDVNGKVLYQPISVFDFVTGTLTNTGKQVFSGTVAGSDPQFFYDDEFFFEVDLFTGVTYGEVFFRKSRDGGDGAYKKCDLIITGTGEMTPEGDAVVTYTGTCTPND